jgi:hypothetical protein
MGIYDDPEHWHDRAEEARATAGHARDPEVKATMLSIALEYERLERRCAKQKPATA